MKLRALFHAGLPAVIALTLAAPAPAHARVACDLFAVVRALFLGSSKSAKRFPILEAQTADFQGAYSNLEQKFVADEIVFSPWLERKTGIRKVTKLRTLGKGGLGIVYEVELEYSGGGTRRMAWKELTKPQEYLIEFERDALKLQYEVQQVDDGILPVELVLGVYDQDAPSNIVALSELGGVSLLSCMWPDPKKSEPPLTRRQRLRLAEIVAEQGSRILAALRKRRVVHHDVKPENFVIAGGEKNDLGELLDGRAQLRLLDFGSALREGLRHNGPAGTRSYWSAWMLEDHTHRSTNDLYALGVILAEILTGKISTLPEDDVKNQPSQYPRPGFSAAQVQTNVDQGLKAALKTARPENALPALSRLERLEAYVLRLLNSTKKSGPTEVFVP